MPPFGVSVILLGWYGEILGLKTKKLENQGVLRIWRSKGWTEKDPSASPPAPDGSRDDCISNR